MRIFIRTVFFIIGLGAFGAATVAVAQENLDAGKSGAQIYAANCVACHKGANGLPKARGILALESFLREHYTASRESAAIIADYLRNAENRRASLRIRSSNREGVNSKREKSQPPSKKPQAKSADMVKSDEAKTDEPLSAKQGEDAKPAQGN